MQRRIVNHTATIHATLDHGLSNGLIESTNTKIRRITRQAYGFHHPEVCRAATDEYQNRAPAEAYGARK